MTADYEATTAAGDAPQRQNGEHYPSGPAVEIVSAGNEVLIGDVLDTNTNWLCVRVTALGGWVRRTVMVRDVIDDVAAQVRAALEATPAILFTVGGLGPTDDDLTLAGVAKATGRPLELHPEAERQVREKYAWFAEQGFVPSAAMNASRRKMALLPRGAQPLLNPVGGAPGVLLHIGPTALVSLPGVPAELKAIVDQSLDSLLTAVFGHAYYEERSLTVDLQDESAIVTQLRAAVADHPHVYIKSRAKVLGSTPVIRITLSARGRDNRETDRLLSKASDQLVTSIGAAGFAARREDRAEM
jgi:molybdopterin-biosynthesis enzyme MoeA-like protein